MYTHDTAQLMLYLQVAAIVLCFVASRAAIYGFHGNASVLRWWARALFFVMMIYILRIIYIPFYDRMPLAVVLESLFSNLGNMCMLALASEAQGRRVRLKEIKIRENLLWLIATIVPLVLGLAWATLQVPSNVAGMMSFAVRATTAGFSAYVMLVVGSVLYVQTQFLKKTQLYLFTAYALYQIGVLAVPAVARHFTASVFLLESMYLAASMFFKVGITISLIAVASQFVRRSQHRAIWGEAEGGRRDEVAVFMTDERGAECEIVRDTLRRNGIESRRIDGRTADACSVASRQALYSVALINKPPSDMDRQLLSVLVDTANVCILLVRAGVDWFPAAWQPKEMCGFYASDEELVRMTESWIQRDINPTARQMVKRLPVEAAMPVSR